MSASLLSSGFNRKITRADEILQIFIIQLSVCLLNFYIIETIVNIIKFYLNNFFSDPVCC